MPGSRKYSPELRQRATRLALRPVVTPRPVTGRSPGSPGISVCKEALRNWVRLAETGQVQAFEEDVQAKLRALETENRELRRSHEILKSAAAFFATEFDRPQR